MRYYAICYSHKGAQCCLKEYTDLATACRACSALFDRYTESVQPRNVLFWVLDVTDAFKKSGGTTVMWCAGKHAHGGKPGEPTTQFRGIPGRRMCYSEMWGVWLDSLAEKGEDPQPVTLPESTLKAWISEWERKAEKGRQKQMEFAF